MLQFPFVFLLTAANAVSPGVQTVFQTAVTTQASPAKEKIAVYQTPNRPGELTIQSDTKAAVQFYLFDVEGTLVYRSELQTGERRTLEGLTAGTYTYHAFQNDKRLKGGCVQLRN